MENREDEIYAILIDINQNSTPEYLNEIIYSGISNTQSRVYPLFHQGYLYQIINQMIQNRPGEYVNFPDKFECIELQ